MNATVQSPEKKLTLPPQALSDLPEKPVATHPKFKEWCVSDKRIKGLVAELDKFIAITKQRIPDASYRIDKETNLIFFLGGAEKETCTTLIQTDQAVLNAGRRNHYVGKIVKESVIEQLERLTGGDPTILERLVKALEKGVDDE